jgi:hypothetical protein
MPRRIEKLTTSWEVEEAFVKLFDQIDYGINQYIGSTNNGSLKTQALQNAVGMLEILKIMYQKDLYLQTQ